METTTEIRRSLLPHLRFVGGVAMTLAVALAIFFLLRFTIDTVIVLGISMEPNFHSGQRILLSKVSYRMHEPERGDVIVFRPVNLEDKDLAVYMDQPVTVGAPFEVPEDPNAAYIRGTFVPTYGIYPYVGSVASVKVYAEAISPGDLAILTASLAGLPKTETDVKPDGKIDFGDLAVMGYEWMEDPYLFGEDY